MKRGRGEVDGERIRRQQHTQQKALCVFHRAQKQFCFIILCPFFFLSFSLQYIVPFLCSTISYSNNTLVWAHTKTESRGELKNKIKKEITRIEKETSYYRFLRRRVNNVCCECREKINRRRIFEIKKKRLSENYLKNF